VSRGPDEESPCGGGVALFGQQHVDNLPVLVDRPVEEPPSAGDLDVGLIDEPPVPGGAPDRAAGVGEQWGEPLHPPVDRDVVDVDTTLGQQLLHVAVGRAVAQVPADRDRDHLRWEPESSER
jgi:hypothetical protein